MGNLLCTYPQMRAWEQYREWPQVGNTTPPAMCQERRDLPNSSLDKAEQPEHNNDQDNSDEDPDKAASHCTLLLRFK